jgi:hypothetical protein
LKLVLVNSLFFLDLGRGGFSSYSVTFFIVNQTVFLAKVLGMLGASTLSASLAKQCLGKAMTIEEWSPAMELLFILRSAASREGNKKTFKIYSEEYTYCQKLLAGQQEAELCIERLQIAFVSSGGEKSEHANDAEIAATRVDRLAVELPSFKLNFLALRLHSYAAQIRMDYRASLELCDRAFSLLDRYPQFSNRARRAEYAIMRLLSSVQIRETAIAEAAIEQCSLYLNDLENNWFTFKECQYLFFMQTMRFTEANMLVKSILSHPRYFTLTVAAREKWELFQLYSLYATDQLVPIEVPSDFSTLIPAFVSDKTGLNTAMILLHILLLVERKQFAELRDRTEFIKGYRKRFLKGTQSSHVAHFFAMLGLIETCDLNYKKISRRSNKLLMELRRMESEEPIQGQSILPYSWIWERLMDRLREYHPLAHKE